MDNACVRRVKQALNFGESSPSSGETDKVETLDSEAASALENEHQADCPESHDASVLLIALPDNSGKANPSEASTPELLTPQRSMQPTSTDVSPSSQSVRSGFKEPHNSTGDVAPTVKPGRKRRARCLTPRSPQLPFQNIITHENALADGSFVANVPRRPVLPMPDVSIPEDDVSTSIQVRPEQIPQPREGLVFTSAVLFGYWREVFPLQGECHLQRGELTFAQFREVMVAPPLSFREDYIRMPEAKFTRIGAAAGENKVFTCHQPHGRRSVLTQEILINMRKRFRRNFGWEAEDFTLSQN